MIRVLGIPFPRLFIIIPEDNFTEREKSLNMEMNKTLYRYIKGNGSKEDRKKVLQWLEKDETHIREYLSVRKLHDLETWNIEDAVAGSFPKKKTLKLRNVSLEFLKIASVLLIGVLLTYYFIGEDLLSGQLQTIHVPSGQRSELILNDGTTVWLNSGTTITFPVQFSRYSREVTLNGEAYFKVEKDEKKPFVVHTENHKIQVLGTEFNVISYHGKSFLETALLEGSIEVSSNYDDTKYLLSKNETLSSRNGMITKGSILDYNYFKWREGLICFEKENLLTLFAKLELYYDIRIINNNKSLQIGAYTGKFRIRDGVEHVLRVLQLKHQFKYTKDDETNIIVIE